jgi:hypothetical protein
MASAKKGAARKGSGRRQRWIECEDGSRYKLTLTVLP